MSRISASFGAALTALMLTACTVQPLHQPESALAYAENNVEFSQATSRVEQQVRDQLIFRSGRGAGEAASPEYSAQLSVSAAHAGVFRVSSGSGQTSAATVTVTGNVTLRDITSDEIIRQFSRSAIASYDNSSQQFANERAALDAENRAARELAEQLHLLITTTLRDQ